ncbi:MAG: N-acetyltransferase [Verrucomicrobiae bacterium]|nr:N-acetyltransferase [Verrucomicrobiae bacterium]
MTAATQPNSGDIKIVPLSRQGPELRRFLRVPYSIYRYDPNWVAPLLIDARKVLSDSNPFFEHAEMRLWVAVRQGRDLGRVAGIIDRTHNTFHNDAAAFFGFFESVNDLGVGRALFESVVDWARQNGMRRVLGPMNPSTNETCGLLFDGGNDPPTFMMPYNPAYYAELITAAGFTKAKDLLAFYVDVARCPLARLDRIAAKVRQRYPEVRLKPVKRATLAADLAKIKKVYNSAWERNWGFVPMTDAEINFLAHRLKPIFMEGLVWLAEVGDEPVGFMLALPDFNIVLRPLRGRLLTWRIVKVIPYLLGLKTPTRCRVLILGVRADWRGRGLEGAMLSEGFKVGIAAGITEAEASWVLEDNEPMVRLMEFFGGRVYRRYRIYERAV